MKRKRRIEPGNIYDWAAKAAEYIVNDLPPHRGDQPRISRIAAIIATHAEPLVALLRESKRGHFGSYLAEECDHDPCPKYFEDGENEKCDCGADKWNARVDAVLEGRHE